MWVARLHFAEHRPIAGRYRGTEHAGGCWLLRHSELDAHERIHRRTAIHLSRAPFSADNFSPRKGRDPREAVFRRLSGPAWLCEIAAARCTNRYEGGGVGRSEDRGQSGSTPRNADQIRLSMERVRPTAKN